MPVPAHTRHYTSTNIINQYILLFRQAYLYLLQYARYEANYTVTLVYEVPDEDLSKGLHAKFTCLNNGKNWFSGKILRLVGSTNIEIKTPIQGWKILKLNMESDWKTRADIQFLREARKTLIHLEQHGIYDYNITFITPFEGYRNIQITSKKLLKYFSSSDNIITSTLCHYNA